jgi:uncharacterized protein with FMN-binding domain
MEIEVEMLKKIFKIIGIIVLVLILLFSGIFIYLSKNLDELVESRIQEIDPSELKDGTYVGEYSVPPVSATVEVIIEGGRIEDIRLLDHGNGMGQPAEAIIEDVVEDQSLDVDSVSGVTYSSRVILKAIEAALIEAR